MADMAGDYIRANDKSQLRLGLHFQIPSVSAIPTTTGSMRDRLNLCAPDEKH